MNEIKKQISVLHELQCKCVESGFYGDIELAEKALEKQQPKKIVCKKGWLSCPTCNACLSKEYGYGKYCEDCGQRLE